MRRWILLLCFLAGFARAQDTSRVYVDRFMPQVRREGAFWFNPNNGTFNVYNAGRWQQLADLNSVPSLRSQVSSIGFQVLGLEQRPGPVAVQDFQPQGWPGLFWAQPNGEALSVYLNNHFYGVNLQSQPVALAQIPGGIPQDSVAGLVDSLAALVAKFANYLTISAAALNYQPLEATLTDIADGTIDENLVNTANPWDVNEGGTGTNSLTDGGILLGSGTGAITALGVASNGQIPIGDGTTDPVLAEITGTANEITVTNGAGSITLSMPTGVDAAKIGSGAVSNTEYGYLDGTTSALQAQINAKETAVRTDTAYIYVQGGFGIWPSTTSGCATAVKVETATNKVNIWTLDFDPSTIEYAEFTWTPPSWNGGTVTAFFVWTTKTGDNTANRVQWALQGRCAADNAAIDQAFGSGAQIGDAWLATAYWHISAATAAITVGGTVTPDKPVVWRVWRVATDANDTVACDACLIAVGIIWTRTQ